MIYKYIIILVLIVTLNNNLISVPWPNAVNNKLFDKSDCGLTYIHKSTRVSNREKGFNLIPTPVSFNITEFPADTCFTIEKAYIWTEISDRLPLNDSLFVTFTDPENKITNIIAHQIGVGDLIGYPNEKRSTAFRADVTDLIISNGTYKIKTNADDWETSGISLFIIYKVNRANYEGHLTIYDGFLVGWNKITQEVNSINVCDNATDGKVLFLASDIQKYWNYDNTDSMVTVLMNINDSTYHPGRNFWNAENFPFDFRKGTTNLTIKINTQALPISYDDDHITWIMNGAYFRTTTCTSCPKVLPVSIKPTANEICWGDTITLFTSIDSLDESRWKTFEWSSNPPGFASNLQNPEVSPHQNTRYFVKSMVGQDCRHGWDTVDIIVNALPIVDAGSDVAICTGRNASLGVSVTDGTPPYNYKWQPSAGLNADNILHVLASPDTPTTYVLTATDSKGCIGRDTVRVNFATILKPVIKVNGSTTICQCDSVELDAGTGYVIYQWSNGETSQKIFAKIQGDYYVLAEDANGCKGKSDSVKINMITPSSIVTLPETRIEAKNGDHIRIPLILKSSGLLDICNYDDWYAKISFNKTLLAPVNVTPLGDTVGGQRIIELNKTRLEKDIVLFNLDFIATLGDADSTPIRIEEFYWKRCKENDVILKDTMFYLAGLCHEGGSRLFFADKKSFNLLQNNPNPFNNETEIEFVIDENTHCRIIITDILGRAIATLIDKEFQKGTYKIVFDGSILPEGTYFYTLQTFRKTQSLMMQVMR